jgi:hypothetical protein
MLKNFDCPEIVPTIDLISIFGQYVVSVPGIERLHQPKGHIQTNAGNQTGCP